MDSWRFLQGKSKGKSYYYFAKGEQQVLPTLKGYFDQNLAIPNPIKNGCGKRKVFWEFYSIWRERRIKIYFLDKPYIEIEKKEYETDKVIGSIKSKSKKGLHSYILKTEKLEKESQLSNSLWKKLNPQNSLNLIS